MCGPVSESLEGTAAVGNGGEGGDKDGGNSLGAGYAVKGSCEVGGVIWDWKWGGDRGHDKITIGVQ